MAIVLTALLAVLLAPAFALTYTVTVSDKRAVPALSIGNAVGTGHSNCTFTFNPAWLDPNPPYLNKSMIIVRASGCSAAFGGAADHLLMAYCSSDGTCEDLLPEPYTLEANAEDPRVFFYNGL